LKALRGDKNAGKGEPVPAAGDVRCPTNLSPGARDVWKRLAPDLIAKGVLTPWDVDEFAAFCRAVDLNDQAQEHIDSEGAVVEAAVFDRNGKPTGFRLQVSPWWQVWQGTADKVLRFGSRFGLSPSDRAQLKVGDGRNQDPAERFLSS
jgi:P27 family predicted phage terminase small subunit